MRSIIEAAWVFAAAACIAAFGIAIQPASAWAQAEVPGRDAWIGVKVMPKLDAEVKAEGGVIDETKFSYPIVVQDVKGDTLLVGGHEKGWIQRSEVVKLDEAAAYYTSFIESGEHLAWAYDRRAITCEVAGLPELALADFEEVLRLEPNARAYSCRGRARVRRQEYGEAIDDLDRAIRLDPSDAAAYGSRGVAWYHKKGYDKAISDFNQAIHLDPNDATIYEGRGRAWLEKHDCAKAIADFNQAIRLDPRNAGFYLSRAAVWSRTKQYEELLDDVNSYASMRNKGCAFGLTKRNPSTTNR